MIRPPRVTRHAAGALVILTLSLSGLLPVLGATPAVGAAADRAGGGEIRTTITSVSPTRMTGDSRVTLAGRITNRGDSPWTDVQAYLVIRREPFTSRVDLATAVRDDPGYAGPRIIDVGRFDEVGDLAAGSSRPFRVSIPAGELPVSGTDGVHAVGVQVLATDAAGERSNDAVSRAVTLLPRMGRDHAIAPTTLVWPFLMPTARSADGRFSAPATLVRAIRPGGRLDNLLDLAIARGPDGSGVIVDPALVQATDDLAEGRGAADVSATDRRAAAQFRDRLVNLGSTSAAWVLDYDRTDVLGLADDAGQRRRLTGAVERATEAVVQEFGLSGNRVSWPTDGGVTRDLLSSLRARGDDPALVDARDLPGWRPSTGSQVEYATAGGDLPLLVDDDLTRGLPGAVTPATLRQRVLATSALASLSRDADAESRASSVVVVDPTWDPGTDDPITRADASWGSSFSSPDDLAAVSGSTYRGTVPRTTDTRPIDGSLLAAADRAFRNGDLLSAASDDSQAVDDARARDVAGVLGVRWRRDRDAGTDNARSVADAVLEDLRSLTIMGPTAVTLSSSQGAFPLTVSNGSDRTVSVGVRLSSSNPALDLPDQPPVEIAAGERQTMTVDVDLEQQNATTVTAQLVTPDGRSFGSTSEFNVRSSRVGAVLWVTMAAAGVFVLVALARRFRRRRSTSPLVPDADPTRDDD